MTLAGAAATDVWAPLTIGAAASLATLGGGLLALRLAGRIGPLLGLTAGIVIGVALFDLMPEALALDGTPSGHATFAWIALGLVAYLIFERQLGGAKATGRLRPHLAPATLTLHSLLDGFGIGIAFQVSPQIGGAVALAVLTHDVADGVNVVSLCLAAERRGAAIAWLIANGMAPLLGVMAGMVARVPPAVMAPMIAVFAGIFLYIGACDLLPRSHSLDARWRTTAASIAGIALMFVVSAIAR